MNAPLVPSTIIKILKEVALQQEGTFIPLHEPLFIGNEWINVQECLDSTYVSSIGKYVEEFENKLAEYTGVKAAIAVVNGTSALHIALKLAGVEQDDEVIIPTLTFVATANAVSYCRAIPHFVDSDERSLGLDPTKLEEYLKEIIEIRHNSSFNKKTGRRIKALVPVHTFGHPVDLDPIKEICDRYFLELVEDAAESLGSFYKGKHTGNFGKVAAVSFNGNKVITTGGGGAILTNDIKLAKLAKHLTTTAKINHPWSFVHDQIGYNYRMPNINAALGCAQLEQLSLFIDWKRKLATHYQKAFQGLEGIRFFTEPSFAKSNYWLNTLILDEKYHFYRDEVLKEANQAGIMTRPPWTLLHKLKMYTNSPRMDLSVAESLERRMINIPSSPLLGRDK